MERPDSIAPPLRALTVAIEDLATHPRNARQGDIGAISESLRRFGQQKPIVAQARTDGPHLIVAGNHLYRAAVALGWRHVAASVVELSDRDAIAYLVADNRTQELGTYDDYALADLLAQLATEGELEATGYDGDDVDALLRQLQRAEEGHEPSVCPCCGHRKEEEG